MGTERYDDNATYEVWPAGQDEADASGKMGLSRNVDVTFSFVTSHPGQVRGIATIVHGCLSACVSEKQQRLLITGRQRLNEVNMHMQTNKNTHTHIIYTRKLQMLLKISLSIKQK